MVQNIVKKSQSMQQTMESQLGDERYVIFMFSRIGFCSPKSFTLIR